MSFLNVSQEGLLITATLERYGFSTWTCKPDPQPDGIPRGKVVTGAIDDCAVDGSDNTLIGRAITAWDLTGLNSVVVREFCAEVGPEPSDGIYRKKVGLNVTIKARMDGAPQGPKRNVPNSGYGMLSAHPELRVEFMLEAPPDTMFGPALKFPGNPDASLFSISGDMLRTINGKRCVWGLVDGEPVGLMIAEPEDPEPPFTAVRTPDGSCWLAIMDYGHRQEGLRDGTGSFLAFRSRNDAGEWVDAVLLNGGMTDRTAGKEQGDLDVVVRVDGEINGIAIAGNMTESGGPPAALIPLVDNSVRLGWPNMRWLTESAVSKKISIGGAAPIVAECVAVQTPDGPRWLPVGVEVA